jgi:Uma2 family endonuclease
MSTAVARRQLTVEEYLDLDAEADETRYEYLRDVASRNGPAHRTI